MKVIIEGNIPKKAHATDACYDLCCTSDLEITPGQVYLVPCGFRMELPLGYEAQIRPRSGLARKFGLSIPNSPGTIDSGYRGDVCVLLTALQPCTFKAGDRIAQMAICKLPEVELVAGVIGASDRGAGGFGSSGV
jgi:dUTP pyrophosphatase